MKKREMFRFMAFGALALLFLLLTSCSGGDHWSYEGPIMVTGGQVSGETQDDVFVFKGIPYAAPPVGALRWKAPQDPYAWDGVKKTVEFASACPQYASDGSVIGNENCLYLNVWRPRTEETNLPVYFWIHGGGNSMGTASTDFYSGRKIATRSNMVVVTINYRLGPLGWLTHPALRHGVNASDDSGNYGTLDIIKALEWVRNNIKSFGGNPNNVMITGESAGAVDVFSMVMSPKAAGLFHKAISQSGGPSTNSIEAADAHAQTIISKLLTNDGLGAVPGGDVEAYLRGKTTEQIFKTYAVGSGTMLSGHVAVFRDGAVIPSEGFTGALASGQYNAVPMIVGSNKEELKVFMAPNFASYTAATYQQTARRLTDASFKVPGVTNPATALANIPGQPAVYAYEFLYGKYSHDEAYQPTGYNAWPTDYNGRNLALIYGSSHALDLPFFWGNIYFFGQEGALFREDNRSGWEALTNAMMAYAAKFAYTGHPGNAGGVQWDPWSNTDGGPKRILLDADDTKTIIMMSAE
jgi:para-nitrobenzyl esterase